MILIVPYVDIIQNGFNAVKTLTVTDFLKVNGING